MTDSRPRSLDSVHHRLTTDTLLVALDIDGTLAPIVNRPDMAAVPDDTRALLARLRDARGVHVAFVTGRSAADGARIAGVNGCWMIGNHGIERVSPDGELFVDDRVTANHPRVARARDAIVTALADIPGVIMEDKRWTLSVHYRLADQSLEPRIRDTVARIAAAEHLDVTRGKMIAEVRPTLAINKGSALLELAQSLGALNADGNVFFAGDDLTDEDAICRLRVVDARAVTVHVGTSILSDGATSAAELIVPDTYAMRAMLGELLAMREGR